MRNSMTEKMLNQFSVMQSNLRDILRQNDSKFSFAIDGWTARNGESFYGLTIHFIDENWQYHSTALDFIPSNGKHTGKDIADIFMSALESYNIHYKLQGKVKCSTKIVTFINNFPDDCFKI